MLVLKESGDLKEAFGRRKKPYTNIRVQKIVHDAVSGKCNVIGNIRAWGEMGEFCDDQSWIF